VLYHGRIINIIKIKDDGKDVLPSIPQKREPLGHDRASPRQDPFPNLALGKLEFF
jgi:hypothetical protein